MSEKFKAVPNHIPWPPILYGCTIFIGFILASIYPLPWLSSPLKDFIFMLGIILFLGGLALDIKAILTLRKHKTTVMPHKGANHLVTNGPFALSRNPIYLGNTILTFGLGCIFANLWLCIGAFIAAFITNEIVIKREEIHLSHKFGSAWSKYAKKVKRWI